MSVDALSVGANLALRLSLKVSVVAVVCDNGEPTLEKCVSSLRSQTVPVRVVIAAGPKTNMALAERLADKVYPPIVGIGKARVNAILKEECEYILSCDSDSVYDIHYAEYAVEDLKGGAKAVKAGIILPLEWTNPLALFEAAFSLLIPYEFALAFRRSEFLRLGLAEEAERASDPRWDIGWRVVNWLNALPDFRMVVYTKMPTYGANYVAQNYVPSLLAGALIPIGTVSVIVRASEWMRTAPRA
jgi:glycosyltransferase involved in cell wall biosynthesis